MNDPRLIIPSEGYLAPASTAFRVVLLALIGCEMFFDVPEYFQLAWRGVFVFVSLSFAVTQMDL